MRLSIIKCLDFIDNIAPRNISSKFLSLLRLANASSKALIYRDLWTGIGRFCA